MTIDIQELEEHLNKNSSSLIKINNIEPLRGGDICSVYKIMSQSQNYFLKTHQPSMYDMLRCEATNLAAIAETKTIRTPQLIAHGQTSTYCYLLLEYLDLIPSGSQKDFGIKLARLHQHNADYFGWMENNWIGATKQPNEKNKNWISFWRDMRLGHQIKLAKSNHAPHRLIDNCEKLLGEFSPLFSDYIPKPSLLHGDLWSGNFAFIDNEIPVIYDPASYFGDHEADLAMTELFGGFNSDFYSAYQAVFPIDAGYRIRKDLYNLYHILNHFNLFGGGYANQAGSICAKVLSEIH